MIADFIIKYAFIKSYRNKLFRLTLCSVKCRDNWRQSSWSINISSMKCNNHTQCSLINKNIPLEIKRYMIRLILTKIAFSWCFLLLTPFYIYIFLNNHKALLRIATILFFSSWWLYFALFIFSIKKNIKMLWIFALNF